MFSVIYSNKMIKLSTVMKTHKMKLSFSNVKLLSSLRGKCNYNVSLCSLPVPNLGNMNRRKLPQMTVNLSCSAYNIARPNTFN